MNTNWNVSLSRAVLLAIMDSVLIIKIVRLPGKIIGLEDKVGLIAIIIEVPDPVS